MSLSFTNNVGQKFEIVGLNDQMAYDDAVAHISSGRPFGRVNMKRLENTYGVSVRFLPDPDPEEEDVDLSDCCVDDDFDDDYSEAEWDYDLSYSNRRVEAYDLWKREY